MARSAPRPMRRSSRPRMEALEDRKLLYATLGGNFVYGSRITYSFAPDGTNIGGNSSAMYQSMAARGFSTAQWQAAFQKAAAQWEAVTNVNFVQVTDDGSSFGASGDQQGDSRFGDIRIGGASLSSNVLASCFLPPAFNGGTLAGDMVFNTSQAWQINNDYDLQTVALHEFGHALGLDHSAISTADMYAAYNGMKQSLTSDDIAGVQSIFGARKPDAFDAGSGNNAYTSATNVTPYLNGSAQAAIAGLDITTATDCDWYVVTAPSNASGTLTVTMQSSGLSSLSPKFTLYSGSLATLGTVAASNSFGATVSISVGGATAGQKYYVKCVSANGAPTNIGAYGLEINFGSGSMDPIPPPNTVVAAQPDVGGGSANEGLIDLPVVIGSLTATGDNLTIEPHYARAVAMLATGWDPGTFAGPPLEALELRTLVAIWHAQEHGASANTARVAILSAIDDVLIAWDRN